MFWLTIDLQLHSNEHCRVVKMLLAIRKLRIETLIIASTILTQF
jgi:hypothetical protein